MQSHGTSQGNLRGSVSPYPAGHEVAAGPDVGKTSDKMSPVSFTKDTAAKVGKHHRTVQRMVEIGKGLDDQAAKLVADTPFAEEGGGRGQGGGGGGGGWGGKRTRPRPRG